MKGIVLLAALHVLIIYQSQKKHSGNKTVTPQPSPAAIQQQPTRSLYIFSSLDDKNKKNEYQSKILFFGDKKKLQSKKIPATRF